MKKIYRNMRVTLYLLLSTVLSGIIAESTEENIIPPPEVYLYVDPDTEFSGGTIFRDKSKHNFDCVYSGEQPAPNITWFLNDTPLEGVLPEEIHVFTMETTQNGGLFFARKRLTIVMSKRMDGRIIKCRIAHATLSQPTTLTKQIHVHPASGKDLQQRKVHIWPEKMTVQEGDSVTVLCQYPSRIHSCRITTPEDDSNSDPDGYNNNISNYGLDKHDGECGVHVRQVKASWSGGNITCSIVINPGEEDEETVQASMELTVLRAGTPKEPQIKILSPKQDIYLARSELEAQCVVAEADPATNITWWLDDEEQSLECPIIIEDEKTKKRTVIQKLSRGLTVADDSRRLVCRVEHPLLQKPSTAAVQLTVVPDRCKKDLDCPSDKECIFGYCQDPCAWTSECVTVFPREVTKLEGESLTVLCSVTYPIDECRIALGTGSIYRLSPTETNADNNVQYFGKGLQYGYCGAYIKKIAAGMRGNVTCFVPPPPGSSRVAELRGDILLTIPKAPKDYFMSVTETYLRVGEILQAKCEVIQGYPLPKVTWWMDDEQILDGLEEPIIITHSQTNLQTFQQKLSRKVTAADNGRALKCRSEHEYDFVHEESRNIVVDHYVSIEPQEAVLGRNDDIKIMCKASGPISSCMFEAPGFLRIRLEDGKLDYYGKGFQEGECGVHLRNLQLNNNSNRKVFCYVTVEDGKRRQPIAAVMNLLVISPLKAHLEVQQEHDLVPGGYLQAKCAVDETSPVANISWWLDDNRIWTDLEQPVIEINRRTGEESISQTLRYLLTAADSGRRVLSCRADHAVSKQSYTANASLDVQYVPKVVPEISFHKVGENFTILCSVDYPLEYCHVLLGQTSYKLTDNYRDGEIAYYGKGLKSGECGATMGVRPEWFGVAYCFLSPATGGAREIVGSMPLLRPEANNDPVIRTYGDGYYREGEQISPFCYVTNAIPAAEVVWLIEDSFASESRVYNEKYPHPVYPGVKVVSSGVRITHTITADDNGRVLSCRAKHPAWSSPKVVTLLPLVVKYTPKAPPKLLNVVSIGEDTLVTVTVRAHPAPSVEWYKGHKLEDRRIFTSEPIPVNDDYYNVTMKFTPIMDHDLGTYTLILKNEAGEAKVEVTLATKGEVQRDVPLCTQLRSKTLEDIIMLNSTDVKKCLLSFIFDVDL